MERNMSSSIMNDFMEITTIFIIKHALDGWCDLPDCLPTFKYFKN